MQKYTRTQPECFLPCVHFFFFARPTDPPSREEGRWEAKHFMGMALALRGSTS